MYLTLIQMTLKTLLNPGEFSSWWKVWLSHLVLLVKLALKNKMHNTIRFETQNRVHQSTQGQLDCGWTSCKLLVHVQIRVCVYWVMGALFLYGSREGHKPQSLIKPLHQPPHLIEWKGDNWVSSHYIFRNLIVYCFKA